MYRQAKELAADGNILRSESEGCRETSLGRKQVRAHQDRMGTQTPYRDFPLLSLTFFKQALRRLPCREREFLCPH